MISFHTFYIIMILFGLTLTFISIRFKKDLNESSLIFIVLSIFIIGLSIIQINNSLKNPENYQDIKIESSNE